jgi:xylulokinase
LLGLDLGISTVKAALFDMEGRLLVMERDEYLVLPEGDKVEADPELYWTPLVAAIRRLLLKWGGRPERITAVSVASHTETVIPLDASGLPARPAMVWMDSRSQTEANELATLVGQARVLEISGQPEISAIWPLTKFRWLSKNEPDCCRRAAKFLLPEDYVLFRLSGQFVAEQSVWSSSLVLDIRRKTWSGEMLDFGGISPQQLPEPCPSGTVIGTVSEACARQTGLSRHTRVVTGAIDQVCAALAAGNIASGIVTESTGSVLALLATVPRPILDLAARIPCHIHALPDTYCLLPWNPTGGLVLKWFKDKIAGSRVVSSQGSDSYDQLSSEAEAVPPGSQGLLMLPHLEGALFPEYNANARGVFFGITLGHTRGHFVRAIMEAVAFMIRRDLEGLDRLGAGARELRVLGGGAKSRLWSQIKADVCHVRVVTPAQPEAAVLGAAILAAVGAGLYPDIPAAVQRMTSSREIIEPEPAHRKVYDTAYELYVNLYEAVRDLYPGCSRIEQMACRG